MPQKLFAMNFITFKEVPVIETIERPGGILSASVVSATATSTATAGGTGTISRTQTQTRTGTITQTRGVAAARPRASKRGIEITHTETFDLVPTREPAVQVVAPPATATDARTGLEARITAIDDYEISSPRAPKTPAVDPKDVDVVGMAPPGPGEPSPKYVIVDSDRDQDPDDDDDTDKDQDKIDGRDADDDRGVHLTYEELNLTPPLAPPGTRGRVRRGA